MTVDLQERTNYMQKQGNTLPTLRLVIAKRFRNRILFAFAILVFVGCAFASIEIALTFQSLKHSLSQRADELQHRLLSELLLGNEGTIKHILADQNATFTHWHTTWDKNTNIDQPHMSINFPANWRFSFPVKQMNESNYGSLRFEGSLINLPDVMAILFGKVLLVLIACVGVAIVVFPLASRIPNELILDPMKNLLSVMRSNDFSKSHVLGSYSELEDLGKDLRELLATNYRLVEERVELQKMLAVRQTAQMLAHDLRKPFNLIRMVMETLSVTADVEATKELVSSGLPGVKRALREIDDMLEDLVGVGKEESLDLASVNLHTFFEDLIGEFKLSQPNGHIKTSLTLSGNKTIVVDRERFQRAVSNIVLNAYQASGNTGELWIEARSSTIDAKSAIEICIGNSGSFIEKDKVDRIFSLFYSDGKKKGSGLGLAIAQKFIRAHGGKIWCCSGKEKGTEFFVKIPLLQAKNFESTPSIAEVGVAKEKVPRALSALVIDDEPIYADLAERVLKSIDQGMRVVKCNNPNDAITHALEESPQLIICDVELGDPRMDGHELVKTIRSKGSSAVIHVHTNRKFNSDEMRAKKAGANSFAEKPFCPATARDLIGQVPLRTEV